MAKKLTIITGKRASGKTQIAIEKSIECLKEGKKVIYLFYEDTMREIGRWFMAKVLNKDKCDLTNEDAIKLTELDIKEIFGNLYLVNRGFINFETSEIFDILNKIEDCDVIVVDYLQAMNDSEDDSYSLYIYNTIRDFIKKYKKEVYLVVGNKKNYRLGLEDLSNYDEVIDTEDYFKK